MSGKTVLYYTFGNHMHWVDMEWLWGYGVLPGSIRDTLRICQESGAKGNINFDGIGYEKLASEHPDAFAELHRAVRAGTLEIVGGSYGQPYGLFHGGESNVRQRIYGARVVKRLFDVRLRTFWEEEFDFFPQLPQMLAGVGITHASLFFQWTWHTPHLPEEDVPAVWWTGMDGSRLLAAPKGPLNLHQWPEDFARLLDSDLPRKLDCPGVVQWLELLPSSDWMCRAELMLPPLRALLAREDYDVRLTTLRAFLGAAEPFAVERSYGLDEVFHGVSLGKNGDAFRRLSRRAEECLLAAEAVATLAGYVGRPYPRWDVYPTWELEEAWRELLSAQHHDNDECEGLCGHVGQLSYERSLALAGGVLRHTLQRLAKRTTGEDGRLVVFNPLGWERDGVVRAPSSPPLRIPKVPPFGYRVLSPGEVMNHWYVDTTRVVDAKDQVTLQRHDFTVVVDRWRGVIDQICNFAWPAGVLAAPVGELRMMLNGREETFEGARVEVLRDEMGAFVEITRGNCVTLRVRLAPLLDAVDVSYHCRALPRPDPGVGAALTTHYQTVLGSPLLLHDHPYGVSVIRPSGSYRRKYPMGDWMTSQQWFEVVERPFTALSLLDIHGPEGGLLVLHDGSQAFQADDAEVRQVLSLYDPWDEDYFSHDLAVQVRLIPHAGLSNAERWRLAQEFTRGVEMVQAQGDGVDLPPTFAVAQLSGAPGVAVTSLYREMEDVGRDFDAYVGRGANYPLILRLVELNGAPAEVRLEVAGRVETAWKTNLLGEGELRLEPELGSGRSVLQFAMRPHEIATLYLDVAEARKIPRDLDARRGVWAHLHHVDENQSRR